jgi:hypothetical protein
MAQKPSTAIETIDTTDLTADAATVYIVIMTLKDSPTIRQIPFYASYASFYRAMNALKKYGLPPRLETRVLTPRLGDDASRIIAGFSTLGWIDENGRPTDDLKKLVMAFGENSWSDAVADVMRRTYSFIPGDWADLTPSQLRDAFVAYVGHDVESLRPAETFFLCLATEGALPIYHPKFHPRVARAIKDAKRSIRISDENKRPYEKEEIEQKENKSKEKSTLIQSGNRWIEQILNLTSLIDELDMTDREKNAVLILLSYLRKREQREHQ